MFVNLDVIMVILLLPHTVQSMKNQENNTNQCKLNIKAVPKCENEVSVLGFGAITPIIASLSDWYRGVFDQNGKSQIF